MFIYAVLEILFFISAFSYTIYLLSFVNTLFFKESNTTETRFSVSVLICAKNEAKNLKLFLPSILNQDYPNFEVILINDQSTDETALVLEDFQNKYSNLKVFSTTGQSHKKNALQLAKLKAKGEVFVQTDADCKVASKKWLSLMCSKIDKNHEIVLGYGPNYLKNGFLNSLQNFETLTTALQYFTAALGKSPYMGVGRNMAYTRKLNNSIEFSPTENKLLSGDDDLFIQHAKSKTQFSIQINPSSFAYSKSEDSLIKWYNQKRRHITTSTFYSLKDKVILTGIFLMKLYFWLYVFSFLFVNTTKLNLWLVFAVSSVSIIIYAIAYKKFKTGKTWLISPILDFCLICFQFSLYISNLVAPYQKWK